MMLSKEVRKVLECGSPLPLLNVVCQPKRQRTAALQDATAFSGSRCRIYDLNAQRKNANVPLEQWLTRRRFLACSLAAAVAWSVAPQIVRASNKKFRACIIGHTGHGDYGHDHDLIFKGRENIEVAAVADPDAQGRAKAAARSSALRSYADYREMLQKERPNLVCITPRWTNEHRDMALAALSAGAHIYLEKPITQTLAEADEILELAAKKNLKVTVAHQVRLAPNILLLKQVLAQGLTGDLLEIRSHGKQDHRAGGEDLIVLGVHLFDLMRFFAGDPLWCSARVLQDGHEITRADAHAATENIGSVAGDDIIAEFGFSNAVYGTFFSRKKYRESAGPYGMEFIGSKGRLKVLIEMIPQISVLRESAWKPEGKTDQWRIWEQDPTLNYSASERGIPAASARVVDDWLAAIESNREPACSGVAAMKALEMAHAVFAAGLSRARAQFPLQHRHHPLG